MYGVNYLVEKVFFQSKNGSIYSGRSSSKNGMAKSTPSCIKGRLK